MSAAAYNIAVAVEHMASLAARVAALIREELPENDPVSAPLAACALVTAASVLDGTAPNADSQVKGGSVDMMCQMCAVLTKGIRS